MLLLQHRERKKENDRRFVWLTFMHLLGRMASHNQSRSSGAPREKWTDREEI
jgi:hypothetical protein